MILRSKRDGAVGARSIHDIIGAVGFIASYKEKRRIRSYSSA